MLRCHIEHALRTHTRHTCDQPPVVAVKCGCADAAAAVRVGKGKAQLATGHVPHAHSASMVRADRLKGMKEWQQLSSSSPVKPEHTLE
jgi:hypothetical protein